MSLPVNIVVPPSKEKKNCPGEMSKRPPPPVTSIAKSQMFFTGIRVAYGLRRHFSAYLVAIMTSLTNQTRTIFAARLLNCTDSEQLIFLSTLKHVSSFL